MDPMEQIYRFDMYISCHGLERLPPTFTVTELASSTANQVRNCLRFLRTAPAVFFDNTGLRGNVKDNVEAVLQTRPNGVVLFLITPGFFSERRCVAEFRAFQKVQLDPEVNLKRILVCLGFENGNLSPSVKEQVRGQSYFALRTDIIVTTIEETSACLCEVVFEAFECSKNLSPLNQPTVLGRTRAESFLALQTVFKEDYLPTFSALLSVPSSVTNVLDAFIWLNKRGTVTQDNVEKLSDVIWHHDGPDRDAQLCTVTSYEQKWDLSHRLDWGVEFREKLSRLFDDTSNDTMQGSSSALPQKRRRMTRADKQEKSEPDQFKPYFDNPHTSRNVVLDFKSCDENGNPVTTEGRLLRKVLEFTDKGHCTVSASGTRTRATHSMGGVGKTTALRALCYEEEVKNAYRDGISFLEVGGDANDAKLIKQVARLVRMFGGEKEAEHMNSSVNLPDVLERGAVWLRDKTVLLVCDDLWKNRESRYGYLYDLASLLREAPRSRMVISTRDRDIAYSADEIVEFSCLDVEGGKAREILLAGVPGIEARAITRDAATEDFIRRILRICAGLPLALAIAGRGLSKALRGSNTKSNGVKRYCALLEQDVDRLTMEGLEVYHGLAKVIESSLRLCQEWGSSDEVEKVYGRKLDMVHMFKGLCVLEKQVVMPIRLLMHVWDTDDPCTKAVMEMFADCYLANCSIASMKTSKQGSQQEIGLRLHDLVLVLCQRMAGDELATFHNKIVDAYGKEVGYRNSTQGEELVQFRAWWRAHDDGYVFAHLSRHLVLSGLAPELHCLLREIRWTLHQMEVGGSEALNVDFEYLFGADKNADRGIRRVQEVLMNSLPYTQEEYKLLSMYVCAHLSAEERNESSNTSLFQNICRHLPKLWLLPATRYVRDEDEQEKWKAISESGGELIPSDMIVGDWTTGEGLVAYGASIASWCTNTRGIDPKISYVVKFIKLSADGKLIFSVSSDGSLRRWDGESGAPIGDPLRGHEGDVTCIALSADGMFFVSGSSDGTVRRWDIHSGAPIGDSLRGHKYGVISVAISDDGKTVVSVARDKTVQTWDVERELHSNELPLFASANKSGSAGERPGLLLRSDFTKNLRLDREAKKASAKAKRAATKAMRAAANRAAH